MPLETTNTTTESVRLPPHSTEAEQGLLGSLLIDLIDKILRLNNLLAM